MGTLFADMLVQADVDTMSASTRSAISFKYWFTEVDATSSPVALKSFTDDTQGAASPATCTVLVSKNTGRYRSVQNETNSYARLNRYTTVSVQQLLGFMEPFTVKVRSQSRSSS